MQQKQEWKWIEVISIDLKIFEGNLKNFQYFKIF